MGRGGKGKIGQGNKREEREGRGREVREGGAYSYQLESRSRALAKS